MGKSKMIIVEDLQVKVTYTVGLGNVEMPESIYEQLIDAAENCRELDPSSMSKPNREAAEWLSENIKEGDCMDWQAEIENITDI